MNMFCPNCGNEIKEGALFCAQCGTKVNATQQPSEVTLETTLEPASQEQQVSAVTEKLLAIFKDKLFLVISILLSASTLFQIAMGSGLPVTAILFTIFTWICYIQATSNKTDPKYVKWISGTVFAEYVLLWVAFGGMALVTLTMLATTFAADGLIGELLQRLEPEFGGALNAFFALGLPMELVFVVATIVFAIATAIIGLYNGICVRNIHKFTKTLHTSASLGFIKVENLKKVSGCLIAVAVYYGLSAISTLTFMSLMINGTLAATAIIGALLLKKYFSESK